MEDVLDHLVAELNALKNLDYADGGFRDQISLVEDVWWGNPGIMSQEQYPFMMVEPVRSEPAGMTTGFTKRTLTIRIRLDIDPREYYDVTETSEATASREMVRTMGVIERYLEKTRLMGPGGLGPGTRELVVSSTEYEPDLRGELYSQSAQIMLSVEKQYPRSN